MDNNMVLYVCSNVLIILNSILLGEKNIPLFQVWGPMFLYSLL